MKKILMMITMLVLTVVSVFAEPVKQDVKDVNAFAINLVTEYMNQRFASQFTVYGPRKDGRIVYTFKGEQVDYDGERNVVLTEKGLNSYDIIMVFENGGLFQAKNVSKKSAEKFLGNIK